MKKPTLIDIHFKMTEDLRDDARRTAQRQAMTLSEFMRQAIANEIHRLRVATFDDPRSRYTGEPQ